MVSFGHCLSNGSGAQRGIFDVRGGDVVDIGHQGVYSLHFTCLV